jgi:uncharacterized protein YndB with AHSA1/START domain
MKGWLLALVLWAPTFAENGVSFVNEGVVDAPVEEVWKLVSTSEGYKVLGPAQAEVDLRVGGKIRTRYGTDGPLGDDQTIENRILAFEPPTMMAIQIAKPPRTFPFKEAWKNPWTVLTLKPLEGGRTLVRSASLGYGSDPESEAMRKFFEAGNQEVIQNIQKHFSGDKAK